MLRKLWRILSGKSDFMLSQDHVIVMIALSLGMYHLCLLILYCVYDMGILIAVNIFSVLLYVGCAFATQFQVKTIHILRVIYAEIIMQVLAAGILLGHQCGFQFYLVALTCHSFYTGYLYRNDDRINPMRYVMVELLAFVLLRIGNALIEPMYRFRDPEMVSILYAANFFTAVIVVVMAMSSLLSQIIHLESRLLQKNKDLEILSHTDALTGLVNRRSIEEKYRQVMEHSGMYAIILADIDDFKQINDTYGHNIGDMVLKQAADIFKGAVRGDDMVCRWGGEEVLVFLPFCKKDGAELTAKRILDRVRELRIPYAEGKELRFSMTFGVSDSGEGDELRNAVQKADTRLYAGKARGKNCIVCE